MSIKKLVLGAIFGAAIFGANNRLVLADSLSIDFENPSYALGNINGQDGWIKLGSYDVEVVTNSFGFASFGSQSLRVSDAVTSGSFGDQTFAKPLTDAVGEIDSTNGGFLPGTLQRRFEMQFDVASTMPTQQSGMHATVSPDRGDGSRMSFLRFDDDINGIDVTFYDVQGTSNPANFVPTIIASDLSREVPHTVKLSLDTADGPSNDVVKVWVDGVLVHIGTSWENYYRYDSESAFEQSPRIVKTVLIRQSGAANSGNSGKGYLFDNLTMNSSTPPSLIGPPSEKNQCKLGQWSVFNNPVFKNQGDCVSYIQSNSHALGNKNR